jgi:hypothetical protein
VWLSFGLIFVIGGGYGKRSGDDVGLLCFFW